LILINLTALGTLGYDKYKRNCNSKIEGQQVKKDYGNREERIKKYVKQKLNLNEQQSPVYFESMDRNFTQTKIMLEKIGNCKKQIIEEIIKDLPDTLKINQLSDSLGYFHVMMQKGTNRHFLDAIKMLDSNQLVKFKEELIKMNNKGWDRGDKNKQHQNQNRREN